MKRTIKLAWLLLHRMLRCLRQFMGCGVVPQYRGLLFHQIPAGDEPAVFDLLSRVAGIGRLVDFDEFVVCSNNKVDQNLFFISFDDGFESSFTVISKIHEKFDVRSLFFVPEELTRLATVVCCDRLWSSRLEVPPLHLKKFPLVSNADFIESEAVMVGVHSATHKRLSDCDAEYLQTEIVNCRLSNLRGEQSRIRYFAPPFGRVKDISRKALALIIDNYDFCFMGVRGNNHGFDRRIVFREYVDLSFPTWAQVEVLLGGFDVFSRAERNKLLFWLDEIDKQ